VSAINKLEYLRASELWKCNDKDKYLQEIQSAIDLSRAINKYALDCTRNIGFYINKLR